MEEKKKTNGKRNKQAGHSWEREVIAILEERGLYVKDEVVTCRSNSRRLDNSGVDLMHLNEATNGMMQDSIQCKTMVKPASYPKLLNNIRKAGRPGPVIFHRQTGLSTSPRSKGLLQVERDRFAITYMENYLNLMACEKFVHWLQKELPGMKDPWAISDISDKLKTLGL